MTIRPLQILLFFILLPVSAATFARHNPSFSLSRQRVIKQNHDTDTTFTKRHAQDEPVSELVKYKRPTESSKKKPQTDASNYIKPPKKPHFQVYGLSLCNQAGFKCIPVRRGSTWKDLFPNGEQREIAMRLNRTNVSLMYRKWLVVPDDWKTVKYMDLSPFPKHIHPPGGRLLYVNLQVFAFAAYAPDGTLLYWGPATGGKAWCSDLHRSCESAEGVFKIYRIQGADCRSSAYPIVTNGGAEMPWCMHYYRGFAIHGSTLSGFVNRSRGCIRLFDADAKWLNQQFVHYGTKVIVKR